MPYGYRIVKKRLALSAFDGEGARLYGGRWNTAGNRLIYTASSRSLATLEILANLPQTKLLESYSLFSVEFPEKFVRSVDAEQLPTTWQIYPAPVELQELGDAWIIKQESAVLAVPSAIIPDELNYLINPKHPDFSSILLGKPQKFKINVRVTKP